MTSSAAGRHSPSSPGHGAVSAFAIEADGSQRAAEPGAAAPAGGWLWIRVRRDKGADWLRRKAGLARLVADALLAEETRPRCTMIENGTLIILRGINPDPEADPEDAVSVRVWIEEQRIITVNKRPLGALDELGGLYAAGNGPASRGDFVIALGSRLADGLGTVADEIEDEIDALEDEASGGRLRGLRPKVAQVRRRIVPLRRHIAPMRDAFGQAMMLKASWIDEWDRLHMREVADHVTRIVENLDAARDRASLVQDEISNRLTEQMDRTIYALSIVAGIFLPISFLTGLLGINVGGMPGVSWPGAFWTVVAVLAIIVTIEVWIVRRLGWYRHGTESDDE